MYAESPENETWLLPSTEENLDRWHAVVPGAPGTPYAYGMFHFDIKFDGDYPYNPPKVKTCTTSNATVRFNPNLYTNGKVCLSILGTWQGDRWSPEYNLEKMLMNLKGMILVQNPLRNEPAYRSATEDACLSHSIMVQEYTFRVAIIEVMEDTLAYNERRNGAWKTFYRERITYYMRHYENIINEVNLFDTMRKTVEGRTVEQTVRLNHQGMTANNIKKKLESIYDEIMAMFNKKDLYDCHLAKFTPSKAQDATWNGVGLEIQMFLPKYPQSLPPYVHFTNNIFHTNVSIGGVPYLDFKIKPDWTSMEMVQAVHDLISGEADVRNYIKWLNPKAQVAYTKDFKAYTETVLRYLSRIANEI